MKTGLFALLGLMMVTGCATTGTMPNATSRPAASQPLPPVSASYACRARYNGIDVLYLVCAANPAIPRDTGTCDMQYVAERNIPLTDAGRLELDCHDTTLARANAPVFARDMELEILEAYALIANLEKTE